MTTGNCGEPCGNYKLKAIWNSHFERSPLGWLGLLSIALTVGLFARTRSSEAPPGSEMVLAADAEATASFEMAGDDVSTSTPPAGEPAHPRALPPNQRAAGTGGERGRRQSTEIDSPHWVVGEMLVRVHPSATASALRQLDERLSIEVLNHRKPDGDYAFAVEGLYHLRFGADLTVPEACQIAEAISAVRYAEPNWLLELQQSGSGGRRTGRIAPGASAGGRSSATNQQVTVAVIDAGMDPKASNFKNRIWVNLAERDGKPGVDDDGNGYVDDVHGWDFAEKDADVRPEESLHGTQVAEVVTGQRRNTDKGKAGDGIVVMPLKVCGTGGLSYAATLKAIRYAVDNGASVINLSINFFPSLFSATEKKAMRDVIAYARKKGVIVVNSAGNTAQNNDSINRLPGDFVKDADNLIAVGSTNASGKLSDFSHVGKSTVQIYVQGQDVARHDGKGGDLRGTSFAAPAVSRFLAQMQLANPDLTPAQALKLLRESADQIMQTNSLGRVRRGKQRVYNPLAGTRLPRVNRERAVKKAKELRQKRKDQALCAQLSEFTGEPILTLPEARSEVRAPSRGIVDWLLGPSPRSDHR